MPRYNHAVTLAFEVISLKEDGSDITPDMLRSALGSRTMDLNASQNSKEWIEACCPPHDTYDMQEPLTVEKVLAADHWHEFENHPVEDWQYQVANEDTRQSYKDWVISRLEEPET